MFVWFPRLLFSLEHAWRAQISFCFYGRFLHCFFFLFLFLFSFPMLSEKKIALVCSLFRTEREEEKLGRVRVGVEWGARFNFNGFLSKSIKRDPADDRPHSCRWSWGRLAETDADMKICAFFILAFVGKFTNLFWLWKFVSFFYDKFIDIQKWILVSTRQRLFWRS